MYLTWGEFEIKKKKKQKRGLEFWKMDKKIAKAVMQKMG